MADTVAPWYCGVDLEVEMVARGMLTHIRYSNVNGPEHRGAMRGLCALLAKAGVVEELRAYANPSTYYKPGPRQARAVLPAEGVLPEEVLAAMQSPVEDVCGAVPPLREGGRCGLNPGHDGHCFDGRLGVSWRPDRITEAPADEAVTRG